MIKFVNEKAVPVLVKFKLDGVAYKSASGEQDGAENHPFDEKLVAPGETFEIAGHIVGTADHTGVPAAPHGDGSDSAA